MTDTVRSVPSNWVVAPLGELVDIVRGVTFPAAEKLPAPTPDSVVCLRTSNVQKELEWDDVLNIPSHFVKKDSQWLRPGDSVISMANSYELVGKVALAKSVPVKCTFGGFIAALRPRGFESSYLFYLLRSSKVQNLLRGTASQTVNIANLSIRGMEMIELPLAPLNEQRRIVAKIEELTDRSRRAREALDAVPALLDRFRQAVLAAAFRGEVTAEWRAKNPDVEPASVLLERIRQERRRRWEEDLRARGKDPKKATYPEPDSVDSGNLPDLPQGWCWALPSEVTTMGPNSLTIGPFGSSLTTKDYCDSGVPVIFVRQIRSENFFEDLRYVSQEKAQELKSHKVRPGDLLITKMGSPPGDTAVYPLGCPEGVITADCIKLSPDTSVTSSEFLKFALRSSPVKSQILAETKGVAHQKVSLVRFRTIAIPLPPASEQLEILRLLRLALEPIDFLESEVAMQGKSLQALDQSILAKAFRGELVPQDPNDEPASVLLERIRGEKAEAVVPKAKRGRKPRELAGT